LAGGEAEAVKPPRKSILEDAALAIFIVTVVPAIFKGLTIYFAAQ
jgi:hypothetical protein